MHIVAAVQSSHSSSSPFVVATRGRFERELSLEAPPHRLCPAMVL